MTDQQFTLIKANVCPRCGDSLKAKVCRNASGTCGEDWYVPYQAEAKRLNNQYRREFRQSMKDLGLTRVRGNLGGIYYE